MASQESFFSSESSFKSAFLSFDDDKHSSFKKRQKVFTQERDAIANEWFSLGYIPLYKR